MQDKKNKDESFNTDSSSTGGQNKMANKGIGAQGVDKAPGEETAQDLENFKTVTQMGKKEDGDPSKPSDQPAKENL